MADPSDDSAGPRNMIELARQAGEHLPHHADVGYILVAVDMHTGHLGWVSQVEAGMCTEVLGCVVAARRK